MNTLLAPAPPGLRARESLTLAQRDEMFALLSAHFEGVTRLQFEHDLAEKQWVIELRQHTRLLGFTSLRVRETRFRGETLLAIYSGDTIVAPEAWGTPALARAWIAGVNHLRSEHPGRRCFWLLLSSGFRTYRFLPVFWRDFTPRYDAQPTEEQHALLTQLAPEGYGELFDARTGLVRFPQPQRLRAHLAAVPDGRDENPHIRFFLARNPHHARGDELVCLTEISEQNLTRAGRRMVAASP